MMLEFWMFNVAPNSTPNGEQEPDESGPTFMPNSSLSYSLLPQNWGQGGRSADEADVADDTFYAGHAEDNHRMAEEETV